MTSSPLANKLAVRQQKLAVIIIRHLSASLVKVVYIWVPKHHSCWLLRAFDEHFDLATGCSLNLGLRSDMQNHPDICFFGS